MTHHTQEAKDLATRDTMGVGPSAEHTRPGRTFTPEVDIYEKTEQIVLVADMPGVKAEDLVIDLRDNVLTLSGEVAPPEAPEEADVMREYFTGRYYRQFTLSNVIDQTKIEASLVDGVMTLTLPKVAEAQPRKITVKAG